jgi:AcrR family transcriptional regulator
VSAPSKRKIRRARSDEAKTARRDTILKAAERLFRKQRYESITVDSIALACHLAKGTVYLYFPTKEAIFLELLLNELERWFDDLRAPLERLERDDLHALAALVAANMAARPTVRRLLALLHPTLEQNVEQDAVRSFKLRCAEAMLPTAKHLERLVSEFVPGDGLRFLLHLHTLTVGVGQVSEVSQVVAKVLEDPALAAFRVDFTERLRELLELVLQGWGKRSLR